MGPIAPEVQDLRAVGTTDPTRPRVYGDGEGAELGWDDPERDLQPMGPVHFVLGGRVGYMPSDGEFGEALDFALAPALDIALENALSLHMRLGLRVGGHIPLGPSAPLGEAYLRGSLLFGIHAWQLMSVRLGAELGPEFVSGGLGTGGAAVAQLGIRLGNGHFEIAVELAIDVRPGARTVSGRLTSYTHTAPRIGAFLGATF